MNDQKICPLMISRNRKGPIKLGYCLKERCAWFSEWQKECAIKLLWKSQMIRSEIVNDIKAQRSI